MTDHTSGPTRRMVLSSGIAASAGLLPTLAAAQAPARVRFDGADIIVDRGAESVLVRVSAPGTASVVKAARGALRDSYGFFVKQPPAGLKVRQERVAGALRLVTDAMIVEVSSADGRIRFIDARSGKERIAEAARATAPIAGVPITRVQPFTIGARQTLHGLGQFRDPEFDYWGKQVFLTHANMDAVSPYLVSTAGWGLLWDTCTGSYMRSDEDGTVSFHSVAGDLVRYHVVLGDGMDALIAGYRGLTGRAQLLGKWAYGYWQSKERYTSEAEIKGAVDGHRDRDLPLDAVVLDWRYWGGNENFSGMTFDPAYFPDPKGMIDHVHARNTHIIVSVWPAFGPATQLYKDMEKAGRLFENRHWSGGRVFDVTAADARAIYWKHVDKGLMSIGFDGLWVDAPEPEFMSTGNRYITARAYAAAGNTSVGPAVRNLLTYSYYHSQSLSQSIARTYPKKRPVFLTRSVYPGQQAFGAITWSGDIFAGWQTLRNQVVAGMNFALAGHPHWSCDIGGFLLLHRFPKGLADPAYRELYVRWFQWAAFLPLFRAHGSEVPREVWQFGKPGEPVFDALKAALERRYALLPYIYSVAADASFRDGTMVRALVMDYPQDAKASAQTAQFSFGRDLLVRVVDRPFEHPVSKPHEFIPNQAVIGASAPAAEIAFYEGANFDRQVSRDLIDDLKMSWVGDLPAPLRGKPYSARWTGRIVAQETGRHEIVVTGQGAMKMSFAGKVRFDAADTGNAVASDATGAVSAQVSDNDRTNRFTVDLVAGRSYPFVVEQRQKTANAISLWVEWLTPSQRALNTVAKPVLPVYLPAGRDWYELETGKRHRGGQTIQADVPLSRMPVYARAGAIVPMTPGIRYSGQPVETTELHVYAGADGDFILYEDAGDGDGYLRGEHATVQLRWNDAERSLSFAAREGTYAPDGGKRQFAILLHDGSAAPTRKAFTYAGTATSLRL